MDKMTIRRVRNVGYGLVAMGISWVGAWATGSPEIALLALIGAGAMGRSPVEEGDAVLVMAGGEWAPGWVMATSGDMVVVAIDGSWGKGEVRVPMRDIVLV